MKKRNELYDSVNWDTNPKRERKKIGCFVKLILFILIISACSVGYIMWSHVNPVFMLRNYLQTIRFGPDQLTIKQPDQTLKAESTSAVTVTPTPDTTQSVQQTQPPTTVPSGIDQLKNQVTTYLQGLKGTYGVYYHNIATCEEFGINETEEIVAASTTKIPINLLLFEKMKAKKINPLTKLTYRSSDFYGGTGILQYKIKPGQRYTIDELSRLSIEYSDNIATNMLKRLLGAQNIKDYMRQSGGILVDDAENTTCAKDMGVYMKNVYDFYKKEGTLGTKLMNYFLNTQFYDRIPALLPSTVKVAHKIGNQTNVVNDVGIVFSPKPYILSILSENVSDDKVDQLAIISKYVYDYVISVQ